LKNSPRTSIEFASEIDRASLASVTLEGFCHDFSRIEEVSTGNLRSLPKEEYRGQTDDPKKKKPVTYRAFFTNGFHPQTSRNSFSRPENRVIAGYQPGLHSRNIASFAHAYRVKHSHFQEEEVLADSNPKDFFVEKKLSGCDIQWQTSLSLFGKARNDSANAT